MFHRKKYKIESRIGELNSQPKMYSHSVKSCINMVRWDLLCMALCIVASSVGLFFAFLSFFEQPEIGIYIMLAFVSFLLSVIVFVIVCCATYMICECALFIKSNYEKSKQELEEASREKIIVSDENIESYEMIRMDI